MYVLVFKRCFIKTQARPCSRFRRPIHAYVNNIYDSSWTVGNRMFSVDIKMVLLILVSDSCSFIIG